MVVKAATAMVMVDRLAVVEVAVAAKKVAVAAAAVVATAEGVVGVKLGAGTGIQIAPAAHFARSGSVPD